METILPNQIPQDCDISSPSIKFTRTCRLCLNQNSECILIFSDSIAPLVTHLPVHVTTSDNPLLSPWVCESCVKLMRMVMEFFSLILESYKAVIPDELDNYLKKFFPKPVEDTKPLVAELCEAKLNTNIFQEEAGPNDNEHYEAKLESTDFQDEEADPNDHDNDQQNDDSNEESDKIERSQKFYRDNKPNAPHLNLRQRVKLAGRSLHIKILSLNTFCTCAECGEYFSSFTAQTEHWDNVHKNFEFVLKCIEEGKSCQFSTKKESEMKEHLKEHMVELGYMTRCKECNQPFTNKHLKHHMKMSHSATGAECKLCCKIFSNEGVLKVHMKRHLAKEELYTYSCDVCGKKFQSKAAVKIHHKAVHLGLKDFPCELCDKRFVSEGAAKQHQKSHIESKEFKCDKCDASFKQRKGLVRHIKTVHDKIFDYHCPYTDCEAKYNDKKDLEEHIRTHTGERPYKCSVCGKGFTKKQILTHHERIHLPEEQKYRYSCEMCGKRFPEKGNLMTHMKGVHKVENGYRDPNNYKKQ